MTVINVKRSLSGEYNYADAFARPSIAVVHPEIAKQLALNDVAAEKANYYFRTGNYSHDNAGLKKMAANISADMIKEGRGMSVEDVLKAITVSNFAMNRAAETGHAVANFVIPTWVKMAAGGVVLITVMTFLRPYVGLASKFKSQN